MKDKEFFDVFVDKYAAYQVYPDTEYRRIIVSTGILHEPRTMKVLEPGCGTGAFTIRLATAGFETTGLDISPLSIQAAQRLHTGRTNISFIAGDILKMPFPDESFDSIFCGAILHHLPDQLSLCADEFFRVLKPNGSVYFYEPNANNINAFIWYKILSYNRTTNERALDPDDVKNVFERHGFKDFRFSALKRIQHIYCYPQDSLFRKVMGISRKFINEYVFPNEFFSGCCRKIS